MHDELHLMTVALNDYRTAL